MQLKSVEDIITYSVNNELYIKLVHQLNKDFSGIIDKAIPETTPPEKLKNILEESISFLLIQDLAAYQNLLYRIDVSEKKIKSISTNKTEEYINSVLFLILKREWQKVWFRNTL